MPCFRVHGFRHGRLENRPSLNDRDALALSGRLVLGPVEEDGVVGLQVELAANLVVEEAGGDGAPHEGEVSPVDPVEGMGEIPGEVVLADLAQQFVDLHVGVD
eukprot:184200-Hanusia_phi.AAC.1